MPCAFGCNMCNKCGKFTDVLRMKGTRLCPGCKVAAPPDATHCPNCGRKLPPPMNRAPGVRS